MGLPQNRSYISQKRASPETLPRVTSENFQGEMLFFPRLLTFIKLDKNKLIHRTGTDVDIEILKSKQAISVHK